MSKNKPQSGSDKKSKPSKSSKKPYSKPKVKTVKIESTEVFATDNCGGSSGY